MRWTLLPSILLIATAAQAQPDFASLAQESSESVDVRGYMDPPFEWNMQGKLQAALNEGINLLAEGQAKLAIPHLEEASKLDTRLWVPYYYLGAGYKQLGEAKKAEKMFLIAREYGGSPFHTSLELGKCYEMLRLRAKSERAYESAIDADPAKPQPYYLLGNLHLSLEHFERARKSYRKASEVDPKFLDGEVKLALIAAVKNNKPKEALGYLEETLRKDSLHRQALIFHALLVAEDNPKLSVRNFDRLVRLSPGDTRLKFFRGMLLASAEQYDRAFADLRGVIEEVHSNTLVYSGQQSASDKRLDIEYAGYYVMLNVYGLPDEDASLVRKAYCMLFLGRFGEAIESLQKVKGAKQSPLCLFLRGVANEHASKHNLAYYCYDSALALDPDIADAHKKRGIYRMEMKQWNQAEDDFTAIIRMNSEDIAAYWFRGLTQYHQSKYANAIRDFTKYIETDSSNLEVITSRGYSYQKTNQQILAAMDLLAGDEFEAIGGFGNVQGELDRLLASADTTKAMSYVDSFLKLAPAWIEAAIYKIDLQIAMKKWGEAGTTASNAFFADREVRSQYPDSPASIYKDSQNSILHLARGLALREQNKFEEATYELGKALRLDKKNARAWFYRGELLISLNNKSAGIQDLERAARLGYTDATALLSKFK